MYKLLIIATTVILYSSVLSGQGFTKTSDENHLKLTAFNKHTSIISFALPGFNTSEVGTSEGNAFIIEAAGSTRILKKGAPDLPKFSFSLLVPAATEMVLDIGASAYTEFQNIEIAPSKGNLFRNVNPEDVPFEYGSAYGEDRFFPGRPAVLNPTYILRDYTGQSVYIFPFQYNPVTKVLRVYYKLEIKVQPKAYNQYANTSLRSEKNIVREFDNIYSNRFLNYNAVKSSKYTPLEEHGSMLVISYGTFMAAMQPFVDWKNTIGMPTTMVDIASIGNNPTVIKNYIQAVYDTSDLTFVLLVGDAAQVATNTLGSIWGNAHSDNAYGYLTGNDSYPEVFIGRFSGETTAHVETQVRRSIDYELLPTMQNNMFNRAIGIASEEGPGHNNLYDHEHLQLIRDTLLNYHYNYVGEFYEGSQGGLDAPGNPTQAMISTEFNTGVGLINYTGHGWDKGWATSGFSNSEISTLTNTHILPFIWSVACVNGDFVDNTCFAEAFLRATHNNQPSGAVAALMSTINQSWDPPMSGQLEMNNILTESYTNNIKRTFGGLSMNGCMQMNDDYGQGGADMTDTWTLFGDPSLMVRTDNPQTMAVTHVPSIFIGESNLLVNCSEDWAYVSLTINKNIIATGIVQAGSVLLSFPPLSVIDTITVAVTAYNHIPYIGDVLIIPPTGPYVIYASHAVNDAGTNNNGLADYNESFFLDVALRNVGIHNADSVWAQLSTSSQHLNITNNQNYWGNMAPSSLVNINDAFTLALSDSVPDQFSNILTLIASDNNNQTWQSSFIIKAQAPKLKAGNIHFDDSAGNDNNIVDPGETVHVMIHTSNIGHAGIDNIAAKITTTSPFITIDNGTYHIASLPESGSCQANFTITADPQTPAETEVTLVYEITAGAYSISKDFTFFVGLLPEFWMEDTSVYVCDAYFYDSNGPDANYSNDENRVMTFYPYPALGSNEVHIRAEFLAFAVEANDWSGGCWDELLIYNGPSTSSPLIGSYCGTNWPPVVTSTHPSGALTFKFLSDSWVELAGWKAKLSCIVTASVNDMGDSPKFELYPNPATSQFTLDISNLKSASRLMIYNAQGAIVHTEEIPAGNATSKAFSTAQLSAGLYFIRLSGEHFNITEKLVVY